MKLHEVQPGECLISLAAEHRITLDRLGAENVELLSRRGHAGILLPGDVVRIPPRETATETCPAGDSYRFRRRAVRAEVRLQIVDMGKPRRDEPFELIVDGESTGLEGVTDDLGFLQCEIPPEAKQVIVRIGATGDEFELQLGYLDPIDSVTGLHGRLANLGTYSDQLEAEYGEQSRNALAEVLQVEPESLPARHDDLDVYDELGHRYGS